MTDNSGFNMDLNLPMHRYLQEGQARAHLAIIFSEYGVALSKYAKAGCGK